MGAVLSFLRSHVVVYTVSDGHRLGCCIYGDDLRNNNRRNSMRELGRIIVKAILDLYYYFLGNRR